MPDPVFTPEQISEDGSNRVARTGGQVSAAGWAVTVADWVAHEVGWTGDLPTPVAVAIAGLLTVGVSFWMNRKRIAGRV